MAPSKEGQTLTSRQTAQFIGMSESWLRQTRMRGDGPPFLKLGRSVRYFRSDLLRWLEEQRQSTTLHQFAVIPRKRPSPA